MSNKNSNQPKSNKDPVAEAVSATTENQENKPEASAEVVEKANSDEQEQVRVEQATEAEQAQQEQEQPAAQESTESNQEQLGDEPAASSEEQNNEAQEQANLAKELRTKNELPEAWTDTEVLAWYEAGGEDAGRTESGVLKVDAVRDAKPFAQWETDELKAAIKGELEMSDNKLSAVVKAYRTRDEVPDAWSFRQVLDFYREGVEPDKTSNGVWKTDVARQEKPASSWDTAELEAWGKGEVLATTKAPDNKLAVELKNRLALNPKDNSPKEVLAAYRQSTQGSSTTEAKQATRQINASANQQTEYKLDKGLTAMNQTFIDGTLERYVDVVKPGRPVTEAVGGAEQGKLETMFQYIIGLPTEGVVAGLNRVLAFVKQHKNGAFSADNALRFVHMLRDDARERHTNFIELLRIYTDDNKELRKQADVRHLLRKQPADKQDLLVEFFNKN